MSFQQVAIGMHYNQKVNVFWCQWLMEVTSWHITNLATSGGIPHVLAASRQYS